MNCLSSASIKANFTPSYSISGVVDTQRLIFPNLFLVLFPCFSVPSLSFADFFGPVFSHLDGDTIEIQLFRAYIPRIPRQSSQLLSGRVIA